MPVSTSGPAPPPRPLHFTLLLCLALAAPAASTLLRRSGDSAPALAAAAHPLLGWNAGGPCGVNDTRCMDAKSLEYVNAIRRSSGSADLKEGPACMLDAALAHSTRMRDDSVKAGKDSIFHQNLRGTKLCCGAHFGGENVALHHVYQGMDHTDPTDPARRCVDQFNGSVEHRKNLLNPTHTETALGVLVDAEGRVWCTQILAALTKFDGNQCRRMESWADRERAGQDGVSSTGYRFAHKTLQLVCKDGKCEYCAEAGAKCLPEERSAQIDRALV